MNVSFQSPSNQGADDIEKPGKWEQFYFTSVS